MPICIECRHPVRTLWTQYSGAGDASSNIRLTVCRNCGRFCDKYVEHDFVVLFIDLVLIKPQVYRHLLHNTLMRDRDKFDPSIIRLGTLLLLFDVYLTWARIEKQGGPESSSPSSSSSSSSSTSTAWGRSNLGALAQQPIVFQYLFFLVLCTLSTTAFHLTIRFLTSSPASPLARLGIIPPPPPPAGTGVGAAGRGGGGAQGRANSVSTALLVSSSTKLFPILMVVWDYDVPAAARALAWAAVANNAEALAILLDCGHAAALLLAAAGALARWAVARAVLAAAGLDDPAAAAAGDLAVDGRALWAALRSGGAGVGRARGTSGE
ncbi:putative arv1-like family protein [Rosellinia necatrix]|uniref:Protein ARV n=1 Tax=Rosellinia necatrix TaxID=77044 RepID=A0A1S8A9W4_ROSNE|nr:putative arv1-like family protein [Rosellinia necatrix]